MRDSVTAETGLSMSDAAERVLLTWLGRTDIDCARGEREGMGPIASALESMQFERICILWNYQPEDVQPYLEWLAGQFPELAITDRQIALSSPTNYAEIYRAAIRITEELREREASISFSFHLSPGTPAMQAVWIIIGKTKCPARLIESSREAGVSVVDLPFDIAADFRPDRSVLTGALVEQARALSGGNAFAGIFGHSPVMQEAVARARLAATQDFPALILGESGTGKELFARAIHAASRRRSGPFVPVNCGAIPANLIESALFGHERGAFTGAVSQQQGCLERADGGTLFLDELGELPPSAQVSLLRALNDKRITRVGGNKEVTVDIRIVAATNRDLTAMISAGEFRADLYYRLAVVVLQLPPLRQRGSDLMLLAGHLLEGINAECAALGPWRGKKLSVSAINVIRSHPWYGNVRELDNSLRRAAIWSADREISGEEMRAALSHIDDGGGDVLNRSIGETFSLDVTLDEVARHYLERAMAEAHGNKSEAARLLGLNAYQKASGVVEKQNRATRVFT